MMVINMGLVPIWNKYLKPLLILELPGKKAQEAGEVARQDRGGANISNGVPEKNTVDMLAYGINSTGCPK